MGNGPYHPCSCTAPTIDDKYTLTLYEDEYEHEEGDSDGKVS